MKPLLPLQPTPSEAWCRWWAWHPVLTLEGKWMWLAWVERTEWWSDPAKDYRRTLDPLATYGQWHQRRTSELARYAYRLLEATN